MTKKEQHRAHVLARLVAGALTVPIAAQLVGLSARQVRRLLAAVRAAGPAALAHGNRGRACPRRLPAAFRAQIITLARTCYAGVNDHHLVDLLRDREGLVVSRPTLQRLLRAAGLPSPRSRRPPRHRRRRERMPQAGLLVQMDGSHHHWLQDRGAPFVLHAAIDDATGEVLAGIFREQEDGHGYFRLLLHMIRRYGVPTAAYTDRHGAFHYQPPHPLTLEEQLRGAPDPTQIGRALQELGITWIPARSPQGKGRVERLFGTFQDRLVVELRLANATTLAEAQRVFDRFRPRYNARFSRPPADPQPAWRPVPPDLERICSFKYQRSVQHDNTVQIAGRLLQLRPGPAGRSYAGLRVDVHAALDGRLSVSYRGNIIPTQLLSPKQAATRLQERSAAGRTTLDIPLPPVGAASSQKIRIPATDHPWRQKFLNSVGEHHHAPGVTNSLSR